MAKPLRGRGGVLLLFVLCVTFNVTVAAHSWEEMKDMLLTQPSCKKTQNTKNHKAKYDGSKIYVAGAFNFFTRQSYRHQTPSAGRRTEEEEHVPSAMYLPKHNGTGRTAGASLGTASLHGAAQRKDSGSNTSPAERGLGCPQLPPARAGLRSPASCSISSTISTVNPGCFLTAERWHHPPSG